jgi:hypothetical protein
MFIRLSHTASECSRLRYSVSRVAPEEESEGKDRKDLTGNAGPTVRVALSVLGLSKWDVREGYGSAITNQPQDVAQMVEGKPAKVCHQATGTLEGIGDSSPGIMDKGFC